MKRHMPETYLRDYGRFVKQDIGRCTQPSHLTYNYLDTSEQGKKEGHKPRTRREIGTQTTLYGFNMFPITAGPEASIDRVQPVELITTVTERTSKPDMN